MISASEMWPTLRSIEVVNSKYQFELRHAFVVQHDSLEKIHRLLADRIECPTITAECADNVVRTFDNLEQLLAYENVIGKHILNLQIWSCAKDNGKMARVEFTDKWHFGGIWMELEARNDVVTRLRSDLLDIIAGMRPWYYFLNQVDVFLRSVIIYAVACLSLYLLVAIRGPDAPSEASPRLSAAVQLAVLAISAVYFAGAYALHRAIRTFFPHGTFLIGQERKRFDTMEKWRWGFIVAFVVSLASGFILLELQ